MAVSVRTYRCTNPLKSYTLSVNWQTDTKCMAHACGPEIIENLAATFTVVYAVALRTMPCVGGGGIVPPLPDGHIEFVE